MHNSSNQSKRNGSANQRRISNINDGGFFLFFIFIIANCLQWLGKLIFINLTNTHTHKRVHITQQLRNTIYTIFFSYSNYEYELYKLRVSQLTTQQFPNTERLCFCLLMRLWINRVAFSFMGPWMPTCEFNVGFGRACAWEWKWQYGMVLVTKGTHPEIESLALMWWAALHSWSENDVWNVDCLVPSLDPKDHN